MDSIADQLLGGRRIRVLTIVDNYSRVSPFIGVGFAYKGYDVEEALRTGEAIWGAQKNSTRQWSEIRFRGGRPTGLCEQSGAGFLKARKTHGQNVDRILQHPIS